MGWFAKIIAKIFAGITSEYAVTHNGTTQTMTASPRSGFTFNQKITVMMYMTLPAVSGVIFDALAGHWQASGNQRSWLIQYANNDGSQLSFMISQNGTNAAGQVHRMRTDTVPADDGLPHWWMFRWDGTEGFNPDKFQIRMDKVDRSLTTTIGTTMTNIHNSTAKLSTASSNEGTGFHSEVDIAELFVFNDRLSDAASDYIVDNYPFDLSADVGAYDKSSALGYWYSMGDADGDAHPTIVNRLDAGSNLTMNNMSGANIITFP